MAKAWCHNEEGHLFQVGEEVDHLTRAQAVYQNMKWKRKNWLKNTEFPEKVIFHDDFLEKMKIL